MTEFSLNHTYGHWNESSSTIGVSNCSEMKKEYSGDRKDEHSMILQIPRNENNGIDKIDKIDKIDRQPPAVPKRIESCDTDLETDGDKKQAALRRPSLIADSPEAEEPDIEVLPDDDGDKKPQALPKATATRTTARSTKKINAKVNMAGLQTSPEVNGVNSVAKKPPPNNKMNASSMRLEKRREKRLQRLSGHLTYQHVSSAPISSEMNNHQSTKSNNNDTTKSFQYPAPNSSSGRTGENRPRSFEYPQPGAYAAPPVPRSSDPWDPTTTTMSEQEIGEGEILSTLKLEALPVDEEDNERVRELEKDNQKLRRQVQETIVHSHTSNSVDLDIAQAEEVTAENEHTKVCGLSKRVFWMLMFFGVLVVAAIGSAATLLLSTDEKSPLIPAVVESANPTTASIAPTTTPVPTITSPSGSPTTSHLGRLAEIVMPGTDLSTIEVESDQYLALEWIGYDDPRTEPISNSQELKERFSLVVLFHSTKGKSSWINNARWLSGEHHCNWEMITCDQENNRVVEVDLSENGLNGILATELGNLSRLQSGLFTANANLRGTIPSELGRTALTSLLLSGNDLGGNLPSELGDLENLQFLDVSNNYLIQGIPSEIGRITGLRALRLSANSLKFTIPSEVGKLTQLETIRIHNNFLEGQIPSEIGDMSSLTDLQLQDNLLTGSIPTTIGSLSRLEFMNIGANELSGPIASDIGRLTQLTMLSLNKNRLTGPIPSEVGLAVSLKDIVVKYNRLFGEIPSELGELVALTHLSLWSNRLTGSVPVEIEQLSLLEEVYFDDNDLTAGLESLFCNSSQIDSPDFDFHSDCGGSSPDLVCDCCSK
jgi:hypothetical protein